MRDIQDEVFSFELLSSFSTVLMLLSEDLIPRAKAAKSSLWPTGDKPKDKDHFTEESGEVSLAEDPG